MDIFEYSKDLSEIIDTSSDSVVHELPYSSAFEVEIRASTVVAVDLIMDKITESKVKQLKDHIKYAFQVDWLLWQMGESNLSQLKPHHQVHSIFY